MMLARPLRTGTVGLWPTGTALHGDRQPLQGRRSGSPGDGAPGQSATSWFVCLAEKGRSCDSALDAESQRADAWVRTFSLAQQEAHCVLWLGGGALALCACWHSCSSKIVRGRASAGHRVPARSQFSAASGSCTASAVTPQVGTWVCGCVGAWVRGCVGAWVRECNKHPRRRVAAAYRQTLFCAPAAPKQNASVQLPAVWHKGICSFGV